MQNPTSRCTKAISPNCLLELPDCIRIVALQIQQAASLMVAFRLASKGASEGECRFAKAAAVCCLQILPANRLHADASHVLLLRCAAPEARGAAPRRLAGDHRPCIGSYS